MSYSPMTEADFAEEPVNCDECGAAIAVTKRWLHDHWHDTLTEDYREHPEDY